ncbi:MAG: hypothetical protein H6661_04055 [Ardenticatenaceae bacterium]|nr:hypothetical protein [Ardenticatenaceae bacterium]
MNPMTPGKKTTEFNLTLVTNLVNAVIALAIGYGLLTSDQGNLWTTAILAAVALVIGIGTTAAAREYTKARTALKIETLRPGATAVDPESAE